ncbi:MAG: ThuA domain-containing protein [Saprospiraceae bacterium]|nr:ThuA domain-containing protein [Saprospiraceae bacterium]
MFSFRSIFLAIVPLLLAACARYDTPPRVLIFSKTNGYRHESIEAGKNALVQICRNNGIWADTTENAAFFEEKNLKRYAAVVFLNTNGDVLDPRQEADFERYIQAGGGFMGVHSASATEYTWHWYGGLVGAYFKDHPAIQDIRLGVTDCTHPATRHLGCQTWNWKEEPYNFRHYEPDLQVLLSADESAYKGGVVPAAFDPEKGHPMAWYHTYDGGRAFYTALGHIPETYTDPAFQSHLLGGLQYAIGNNRPLRYNRCRTRRAPDPTRFVKTTVATDLDEPMEIALLPDGKILLIERHGYLKLFNPATGLLQTSAKLPVYSEMGDGLIGLAVDPDWANNHWIYLYYASLRDSLNQLSRFVFRGDTLDRASEKVILEIPVGRKNCFHAAGSMAFDPDGNLLLATGDNTSPFDSEGFAPLDERPGRQAFDAQRSAGNTADLRGKILRIKILSDGSYRCPPGNLFTGPHGEATTEGRPEIYVMGCRNPFRISYDERRKFLFWGDIGPDAGKADTARGPLGHDEINRAREAGNFGWPYFVADNQAYRDFDFNTRLPGTYFDPKAPRNDSPNNTGAQQLPPAQPAFIWYPYGKNRDFPILGTGGRNAMAGPVYYADQYPASTRFPDYYDGKVIVYDWMRSWLMAVTLDSAGNFHRLEPFADSVKLSRPMDMFFDRNGTLWLIEYGTRWYSSNEDARLSRIDFVRDNRAPVAKIAADKIAGAHPATVVFSLSASHDDDRDPLRIELDFGDGEQWEGQKKYPVFLHQSPAPLTVSHTYRQAGLYEAILRVTDPGGGVSSDRVRIQVGNEPPAVQWDLGPHSRSFYVPGETLGYQLLVNDREDGSLQQGGISASEVAISADFLEKNPSPAVFFSPTGQKPADEAENSGKYSEGKIAIDKSDCKSCHALDRKVNGPSYQAIAERYRGNKVFAVPAIYRKIIYGGSGNWGQGVMIPHPQIREEEAIQMALWILSLADPPQPPAQNIPPAGLLELEAGKWPNSKNGALALYARYDDRGGGGMSVQSGESRLLLRPNQLEAEKCDARSDGVGNYKPFDNDTVVLNELKHNAWFVFRKVDVVRLRVVTLRTAFGDRRAPQAGGRLEIRAGSPQGALLGQLEFASKNAEKMVFERHEIALNAPQVPEEKALQDLFFVFKNLQNQGQGVVAVDWVRFD